VIAWIVKRSEKPVVRLAGPVSAEFCIARDGRDRVAEQVLWAFKSHAAEGPEPFIARLEEACDVERPRDAERLFLDWEEAATMARGGMAIGGHTHSHEILATLPPERQRDELFTSKAILETRLGAPVLAMSYPVGLPHTFDGVTRDAAATAGYRLAFSFYGGFNPYGATEPYDVRRFGVSVPPPRFKLQTALAAVTARYWF
jgi:peptidoglycan/xylan/chitin deacetylase (PgdA/CDA1 family)